MSMITTLQCFLFISNTWTNYTAVILLKWNLKSLLTLRTLQIWVRQWLHTSSNPFAFVRSLPRPQNVPPPVAVPPMRSNRVSDKILITETPDPIVTCEKYIHCIIFIFVVLNSKSIICLSENIFRYLWANLTKALKLSFTALGSHSRQIF